MVHCSWQCHELCEGQCTKCTERNFPLHIHSVGLSSTQRNCAFTLYCPIQYAGGKCRHEFTVADIIIYFIPAKISTSSPDIQEPNTDMNLYIIPKTCQQWCTV